MGNLFNKRAVGECVVLRAAIVCVILIFAFAHCKGKQIGMPEAGAKEAEIKHAIQKVVKNYPRTIRVAVMDFRRGDSGKNVDVYVTDEVIRRMSAIPKIRLLERSRLKSLLKQLALEESGMLKAEDVRRIGHILPADVIVPGSYMRESPDMLLVQGRFIDLVTGEILSVFSFRLPLRPGGEANKSSDDVDARCRAVREPLRRGMENLRTEELVKELTTKARMVPFDMDCGKIHFEIIRLFKHNEIFAPEYIGFLQGVLTVLEDPGDDRRAAVIIEYLAADNHVDDSDWQSGLAAVRRATSRPLYLYLRYLFSASKDSAETRRARIEQVMELAVGEAIGKPRAFTPGHVLRRLMHALRSNDRRMPELIFTERTWALGRYAAIIRADRRSGSTVLESLWEGYLYDEAPPELRRKLSQALVTFYKESEKNPWLAKTLWKAISKIENHIEGRLVMAKMDKAGLKRELAGISTGVTDWICESIKRERGRRVRAAQIAYARRNGISCPGVRGARDLAALLDAKDTPWPKRELILKILIAMNEHAAPAEKVARTFLGLRGDMPRAAKTRSLAAKMLGVLKTKDPQSLRLLVGALNRHDPAVGESLVALKNIGPAAVPEITRGLMKSRDEMVRFHCARLLGEQGRDAASALPALERAARRDSSRMVRRAASSAVTSIRNDF